MRRFAIKSLQSSMP